MIDALFKKYVSQCFKGLLYSETWEDFEIEKKHISFFDADKTLCITSGGSCALNSCLEKGEKILSIDINPVQNYVLELKRSAIKNLTYDEFWRLMTLKDIKNKILYEKIKKDLSQNAKAYFDKNTLFIEKGLLNNGVLYGGLKMMRRYIQILVGKEKILKLLSSKDVKNQRATYFKEIAPRIWNIHSRTLSLWSMVLYGVSPQQIRILKKEKANSLKDIYKKRMEEVFSTSLVRENFYWRHILTGKYNCRKIPPYLKEENYARLKKGIKKIEIVQGELLQFMQSRSKEEFNKINLSDVPDWMPEDKKDDLFKELMRISAKNAQIVIRTKSKRDFKREFKEFLLKENTSQSSKREKTAAYNSVQIFRKTANHKMTKR